LKAVLTFHELPKKNILIILLILAVQIFPAFSSAEHIRMAVIQDKPTESSKYLVLKKFLAWKGLNLIFHSYSNYPSAATGFFEGNVDFMFTGSGIAAIYILKELAYPILRPVSKEGWSTYSAVVIATKGTAAFTGDTDFWKRKKVAGCALASSGELYMRSAGVPNSQIIVSRTHTEALEMLQDGEVDLAVVKNRVWEASRYRYPSLECVGQDTAEHPNATLMVSPQTDRKIVERLRQVLLALKDDSSKIAVKTKEGMGIAGFIPTSEHDFEPTLKLLKKAGVSESFQLSP
jgi:ABC-type phosphate/phosphonate transport system substrate-binding protein